MSNADTPAESVEKVDTPAPAATPATPEGGNPPAAPADTPAADSPEETVALSKAEHDKLVRDAAHAKGNQRKAALWDKLNQNGGKSHFQQTPPSATPPSPEEMEAHASEEDRKAERGILAIAADPAYREVFDNDPTLRNLFTQNPMAVLPIYASDAVDADDALGLIKDELEKLHKPAETPKPKETPTPADPETPKTDTPPAGGVNPTGDQPDEAYETAKKNPNTEQALVGMIGAKIKRGG